MRIIAVFLSSPVIAVLIGTYFAYKYGIKEYITRQQISRIQKIYYEESLVELVKHMDNGLIAASKNLSLFVTATNVVNRHLPAQDKQQVISSLTQIESELIRHSMYITSQQGTLITLFKGPGSRIQQWLFKYDQDLINFNLFIAEIIGAYRNTIGNSKTINQEDLKHNMQHINNYSNLLQRHYLLPHLVNQINDKISSYEFNFTTIDAFKKEIAKDECIKKYQNHIDEAFKILFAWYQESENSYISYLTNEDGNRYRFLLNTPDTIEHIQFEPSGESNWHIIINDVNLADTMVGAKGCLYSRIQIGMANQAVFDEPPARFPEASSF